MAKRRDDVSKRTLVIFVVAASVISVAAQAQSPAGGVVKRGNATISQNQRQSTITQTSRRAVIDWKGFDVGRDHTVVFEQPDRKAATLNRVISGRGSVIEGRIRAPGNVIIQNGAGILFTRNARIDTGGLVATSQSVDLNTFDRTGNLRIGGGERRGARVANRGEITIADAGLAALVGREVENSGTIVSRRGTVALASGPRTAIDLSGDGVFQIAVSDDVGDGRVSHTGTIEAGHVLLSASGAADALDSIINTSGLIRATASEANGGRVELRGRGGGEVRLGGRIQATGSARGGEVIVTGESIRLTSSASIDASGGDDGGLVLIGGNYLGQGGLRRATGTVLEFGSTVNADGANGKGGTVVAWADGSTWAGGAISASGGLAGGLIETSGRNALGIGSGASVMPGAGGRWLLDPRNVQIVASGGNNIPPTVPPSGSGAYRINASSIQQALNANSSVTISSVGSPGTGDGNISLLAPLSWFGTGNLSFQAAGNITLDAALSSNTGNFTATSAGGDIAVNASATIGGQGRLTFGATIGDVILNASTRVQNGDYRVTAGRDIAVNKNVTATSGVGSNDGNLFLTAGRDLGIDASITFINGDLTAQAGRDLTSTQQLVPQGGGDIILRTDTGNIYMQQASVISGNLIAQAGGGILAAGALTSTGTGSITLDADTASIRLLDRVRVIGGTFRATAGQDITALGELRVDGAGSVALTAEGGSITLDGPVNFIGGNVNATAGQDIAVNRPVTATGDGSVNLGTNAGDIAINAPISFINGRVTASAGDYVGINAAVSTRGSGNVLVQGDTIGVNDAINAYQATFETKTGFDIAAAGNITGRGPSNAIVIAASDRFSNAGAANALRLTTSGARWLLYINTFAGNQGVEPSPKQPDLYGRTYAANPPPTLGSFSGNRIVYGERPTLTITADDKSKVYGDTVALTYSQTGLRPGDTTGTVLAGGVALSSVGQPTSAPVGAYPINVNASLSTTAANRGYLLVLVPGELEVVPRILALTVTADNQTKTYGETFVFTGAEFQATGLVGADTITSVDLASIGSPATAAVGAYPIIASNAQGTGLSNYTIDYVDGTMTVEPAGLSLVANDQTKTYGQTVAFAGDEYIVQGLVNGDTVTGVDLASAGAPSGAQVNGSPYEITIANARGSGLSNYSIDYVEGVMTVYPATLTITADDALRPYGSDNPAFSATYSGFVNGEGPADLDGMLTVFTASNQLTPVGTSPILAFGQSSANYDTTFVPGTLTITPAGLTVTADDQRKVYGEAFSFPADAFSVSGLLNADSVNGVSLISTGAPTGANVGTYAIAVSDAVGLGLGNYVIAYVDGTMTVDRAALTVAADDQTKTYGDAFAFPAAAFSVAGLRNDDAVTGVDLASAGAPAAAGAGTYAIAASDAVGLGLGNYVIAYVGGTMTVDRAALTVAAEDQTKTYGDAFAFPAGAFSVAGLRNDDAVTGVDLASAGAPAAAGAGTYAIAARDAVGLGLDNYVIAYVGGTMTVDRAALTVAADDASRDQGQPNPPFSASFDGFVLGQGVADLDGTLGFSTPATVASAPGDYAITPGGVASGNYVIRFVDGTLTVAGDDPAPPTPPVPTPPDGGGDVSDSGALFASLLRYERGANPLTPGDATFRTTEAEAPLALSDPFELTYSLGEVVQLAPVGDDGGTEGFVPAAGGLDAEAPAATTGCAGWLPPGTEPPPGCTAAPGLESFWTTRAGTAP